MIYVNALSKIMNDPRYLEGIEYGKPRRGHDEGTIKAHIEQLHKNLQTLYEKGLLEGRRGEGWWSRLQILIHVHDTFKGKSHELRVNGQAPAIEAPESHASLAAAFLREFIDDEDLVRMVQYHDIGYAVFKNWVSKKMSGAPKVERLKKAIDPIQDKNLFALFCIIDACTPAKGRQMIQWFITWMQNEYAEVSVGPAVINLLPVSQAPVGIF